MKRSLTLLQVALALTIGCVVTLLVTTPRPLLAQRTAGVEKAPATQGLTGRWKFMMRTNTWTVQLAPRSGLPGEYKGLAQRANKNERGQVVTMELGAALAKGKLKAWLGPGFVVCEAMFKATESMEGECKGMDGNTGPFRAERLPERK